MGIIKKLIEKNTRKKDPSSKAFRRDMANRIAGLAFALFEYAIIIGLAISLFDNLNSKLTLVDPQTLTDSPVYMYLKDFAGKVFPYLKELASGIGTTGSEITTEIANV